jgi:hypothetical protein
VEETNQRFGEDDGDVSDDGVRGRLKGNPFLALTWLEGGELGEDFDKSCEGLLSVQDRRGRLVESGVRIPSEKGDFNSNMVSGGPCSNWADPQNKELGLVKDINNLKNKGILEDNSDVAMKNKELFMGGCSSKVHGPGGPSQVCNFEYNGSILSIIKK